MQRFLPEDTYESCRFKVMSMVPGGGIQLWSACPLKQPFVFWLHFLRSYDALMIPEQLPFFFSNAKGPLEVMQKKAWVFDMAPLVSEVNCQSSM